MIHQNIVHLKYKKSYVPDIIFHNKSKDIFNLTVPNLSTHESKFDTVQITCIFFYNILSFSSLKFIKIAMKIAITIFYKNRYYIHNIVI